MGNLNYGSKIPKLSVWQKDSSVQFAYRKDDRILVHIDWLVEKFHRSADQCDNVSATAIVGDLFFTLNTWVKLYHQKHRALKPGRYPAIMALFQAVVGIMCKWLGCTQNQLLQQISFMFGSALTDGGSFEDSIANKAKYFSRQQRSIYRLHFRGGMAHQYPWWLLRKNGVYSDNRPTLRLQPAESFHAYNELASRGGEFMSRNFGSYVCTLEREFFMCLHEIGNTDAQDGVYHSSYTQGGAIIGAGSMLIENGTVTGIREDSGHYMPGPTNMVGVLQALGMYGVDFKKVKLYSWKNAAPLGNGVDFLRSNLSWQKYVEHRNAQLVAHQKNHPKVVQQPNVVVPPGPPPVPPPVPQPSSAETTSFYS